MLRGEGASERLLVDHLEPNDHLAESLAGLALGLEGLGELILAHQAVVDEDRAEPLTALDRDPAGAGCARVLTVLAGCAQGARSIHAEVIGRLGVARHPQKGEAGALQRPGAAFGRLPV